MKGPEYFGIRMSGSGPNAGNSCSLVHGCRTYYYLLYGVSEGDRRHLRGDQRRSEGEVEVTVHTRPTLNAISPAARGKAAPKNVFCQRLCKGMVRNPCRPMNLIVTRSAGTGQSESTSRFMCSGIVAQPVSLFRANFGDHGQTDWRTTQSL